MKIPSLQDNNFRHAVPQNSYSRELDSRVQAEEMPYGYLNDPPPADSGNYDSRSYETHMQSRPRK